MYFHRSTSSRFKKPHRTEPHSVSGGQSRWFSQKPKHNLFYSAVYLAEDKIKALWFSVKEPRPTTAGLSRVWGSVGNRRLVKKFIVLLFCISFSGFRWHESPLIIVIRSCYRRFAPRWKVSVLRHVFQKTNKKSLRHIWKYKTSSGGWRIKFYNHKCSSFCLF